MEDSQFEVAVFRVLGHEGGYSNHPADPGGETMWGITKRVALANGYKGEMRFLPREEAIRIYENEYWLPIKGDSLPFPVAFQLFDTAVNSGPVQAIKLLQRALGVKDDGVLGPITLSAAKTRGALDIGVDFLRQRLLFQASLPAFKDFGRGWINRAFTNLSFLLKDAKETQRDLAAFD